METDQQFATTPISPPPNHRFGRGLLGGKVGKKDILDIDSLTREEITYILDTARGMKEISQRAVKKVPTLRGKTIVLFFQEPST
ncbi:MAG: hypothetical protein AB7U43_13885, partial [Desulfobacter sp.]